MHLKSIKLTKKVTFKEQMLEFRQVCTQNLTKVVQISQKLLDFETLHGLQTCLPNLPIFIHRYIHYILQFCVEGVVSKNIDEMTGGSFAWFGRKKQFHWKWKL